MNGEPPWLYFLVVARRTNQLVCQCGFLSVSQHPPNDIATKNVDDDIEVEVVPFDRTFKFGDVP